MHDRAALRGCGARSDRAHARSARAALARIRRNRIRGIRRGKRRIIDYIDLLRLAQRILTRGFISSRTLLIQQLVDVRIRVAGVIIRPIRVQKVVRIPVGIDATTPANVRRTFERVLRLLIQNLSKLELHDLRVDVSAL